ncbi:hypothetical protein GH714_016015 [Hevea brasiliensis]|uniref:C-JID domain-containing protein n=1 Tax=Hevea brasiliensis TaxID=3981 RepID=A0A6A6KPE0_HEVBR|nr:hypothetical protein GH714_016015 [Hevea brasiliensis]
MPTFRKTHDYVGLSLPSLNGLHSLTELDLSDCNLSEEMIPGDFYCLSSLQVLNISRNNFVNTPASISQLPQLRYLYLDDCKNLKALRKLPATIHEISANNCISLETLSSPDAIAGKWMWPIFYFTNCFKLSVNQGGDSMPFKFLRSHLQSLSMNQLQVLLSPSLSLSLSLSLLLSLNMVIFMLQDVSFPGCRFDVIVPGIEVPNWFIQQHMGPSVVIPLPPNWYNEKFKGLAVCPVFAICENPDLLTDGPASDIAIYCTLEAIDCTIFKFLIYRIPSIQSDHLWMGFHSRIGFGKSNQLNKCRYLRASFESPFPGLEVKKCGIRLVYDQDENDYNPVAGESSHSL